MIRLISEDVVLPSDRSRIVDTQYLDEVGAWYVKADDGALRIANETLKCAPGTVVCSGNRSRIVDAGWLEEAAPWCVKDDESALRIANETMSPYHVRLRPF